MLSKTVAAEPGAIDVPVLAPHLEFRPIDDNQTLLVSESFNTLLRGEIHRDLLPLLDGRRTQGDIVGDLEHAYSAVDIRRALAAGMGTDRPTLSRPGWSAPPTRPTPGSTSIRPAAARR